MVKSNCILAGAHRNNRETADTLRVVLGARDILPPYCTGFIRMHHNKEKLGGIKASPVNSMEMVQLVRKNLSHQKEVTVMITSSL
jgi:hypothetical protein